MVQGVVLVSTGDALAMIRHTTLFFLTLVDGRPVVQCTRELLGDLPTEAINAENENGEGDADAETEAKPTGNAQHPAKQGITATAFFQADPAERPDAYALLLLVNERTLAYYEVDVKAKTVELRSCRSMPRNSTCMAVGRITVADADADAAATTRRHVVLVGEKTGEAVAMPFPDLERDLKTLLGHTTSMIVHMAMTHDHALLLTADRDEKIRVSHFPRAALVESYCLGHTASLTRVVTSAVAATPDLAVSTSLDNTIKLWNIKTGALLDSHNLVADEDKTDALLRNVSLAICPVRNVVVVALNHQQLRFFAIEDGPVAKLVPKELATQIQGYVNSNAPSEATFTSTGHLAIAYRQSPFLRLFEVSNVTATNVVLVERSNQEEFSRLRKDAAQIELAKEEEEPADDVEGGLKKKKVKLNDWKSKLPVQPATN